MQTAKHKKALDRAIDVLLAISNMAFVARSQNELEVIHLQAIAQGIEALANPLIDDLIDVAGRLNEGSEEAAQ